MSDNTADEIRAAQAARREARLAASANQPDAGLAQEPAEDKKSRSSRFANYDTEIDTGVGADMDVDDDGSASNEPRLLDSFTAPKHLLHEFADEDAEDPFAATAKSRQVAS
ncbi:hypothetical protein JCM8097_004463, partial [Rhodosporidiobolus ruineniae]